MFRLILKGILFLFVLTACSEIVPDLKGNLVGYIRSLDEFGSFNNDDEGFEVIAVGQAFFTTYTDENGRFEFRDLPAGTYQISIFKEGYGMMKEYSIQHLGGAPTILHVIPGGIEKYFIYRLPETTITEISVANNVFSAKFNFQSTMPGQMRLRIYYSDIPVFEETEIKRTETRTLTQKGEVYSSTMETSLFPFVTGQRIYMRACVLNAMSSSGGLSTYYDPELARTVYPNLGEESNEFSFIFNE